MNNLKEWGLTPYVLAMSQNNDGLFIGRVKEQNRNQYQVITSKGILTGEVSGKFKYHVENLKDYPVVGDWVLIDREDDQNGYGIIHQVINRKSSFSRKVAGKRYDEQVLASNLDKVFICMSLNKDYHLGKLERFISQTWESHATPVVVLTKMDLCHDIEEKKKAIERITLGIEVHYVSSYTSVGIDSLKKEFEPFKTYAFIGASGVGKSTLVNLFMEQEVQSTLGLRNDDKGRHTTTTRSMFQLPNKSIVIDTPGIRELGMFGSENGIRMEFSDIETLSKECRFKDCTHTNEPGCAVLEAIETGEIEYKRLSSFQKLLKEEAYLSRKLDRAKNEKNHKQLKNISKYRKQLKSY